jgi:hypothetical protein
MTNNACRNKPLCHKPMAHYTLFFTLNSFCDTLKTVHQHCSALVLYITMPLPFINFSKNIFVSATNKHQDQ